MSFKNAPSSLLALADYLKKKVNPIDAISIERRVEVFEGQDAMKILLHPNYNKEKPKNAPEIHGSENAKVILKKLLGQGFFVRGTVKGSKAVPLSAMQQQIECQRRLEEKKAAASGSTVTPVSPPTPQPRILVVEPDPVILWTDESHYIWIYEGSILKTYLYSFGLFIITLTCVMYQLWPPKMRYAVWLVAMAGLTCIGSLIALAIVRLILYVLSKPVSIGLWIFPNLFEDCGFFESFVPFIGWDVPENASILSSGSKVSSPNSTLAPIALVKTD